MKHFELVTDFLKDCGPSGSKDTNANNGAKKESEADEAVFYKDFLNDESSGSDPQQPTEPVNEYGGFVRYNNTRRKSLPRAARMRAKRPRECSESETDGETSRRETGQRYTKIF